MFKIDPLTDVKALSVQPRIQDRATGEQKLDVDGVAVWSVTALHVSADPSEKPELIQVSVSSRTEPEFQVLQSSFEGLMVGHYSIPAQNNRPAASGLFFRATRVVSAGAKKNEA